MAESSTSVAGWVAFVALAGIVSACGSDSSGAPSTSSVPSAAPPASGSVEQDGLVAGLLDTEVLGVFADWAVRDVDPTVASDPDAFADTDPFLGLLDCPEGVVREGEERAWLARRYSAPEVPLDNGLLSIEIIVEVESAEQWVEDRAALDDCTVGAQAEVQVGMTTLSSEDTETSSTGDGAPDLDAATLELLASPTADVPYSSAFNATTSNAGGLTVTVIAGGIDMGESWQSLTEEIAVLSLDRLSSSPPPR